MQRVPSDSAGSSVAADTYVADLHIHSRFSRACSRDLTLPNLAWWARRKGIALLGTGDFTHPGLVRPPAREPATGGARPLPAERRGRATRSASGCRRSCRPSAPARFMLSVEISTIYKRDDRTRKVHHLIYLPDFEAAARFNTALGRIGNLTADGRPILGLDSRDLLEIALEASPDGYLVPAHIWTPWFSALGSKSGFDAIADCYADLADHITAVETGLSSDPEMNWRVSSLDRYRLVSNSDAHSPAALAREATLFTGAPDYFAVKDGTGLAGTLEFFPEEGKYHADGHRACGVNWAPAQTRRARRPLPGMRQAADRRRAEPGRGPRRPGRPARAGTAARRAPDPAAPDPRRDQRRRRRSPRPSRRSCTTWSPRSARSWTSCGPIPLDAIGQAGGENLREAIGRLRRGDVRRVPGYDGEYGVITLFEPGELRNRASAPQLETLFDVPQPVPQQRRAEPAIGRAAVPQGRPRSRRRPRRRRRRSPRRRRRTSRSSRCWPAWRRSAPACWTGSTPCSGWPPRRRAGRC